MGLVERAAKGLDLMRASLRPAPARVVARALLLGTNIAVAGNAAAPPQLFLAANKVGRAVQGRAREHEKRALSCSDFVSTSPSDLSGQSEIERITAPGR